MVLPLLLALSVTASDAICAVRGWTRQGGTLTVIGAPVKADRFETAAGNAFYAVKTSEGTVFTAADTDYDPIIAFTSAVADFSEIDPASPMWALMTRSVDFACYNPDAFARWQELLAAGSWRRTLLAASQGIDSIGDVRVDPLTTSKWGQGTNGIRGCYNYYTPGYSVCGCVATAMAQVMYHHRYPTTNVKPVTKTCWYGSSGVETNCTMIGGIYNWVNMRPDPSDGNITLEERQAIGTLTYDCGVASQMWWKFDGFQSGTLNEDAATGLHDNFDYSSTTFAGYAAVENMDNIGKVVLCNLDAGLPVIFGIVGKGGHSVVGDGYGYNQEDLYIHLNMGWSGTDDLWYNLPAIYTPNKGISFDVVTNVVYNIIPDSSVKGVFSGRLLNESKKAVANFPIKVCDANGGTITNLTTNAYGVYGFWTDQPVFTIQTDADATYDPFTSINQTLSLPGSRAVEDTEYLGNSWGNDFTLKAKPVTVSLPGDSSGTVDIPPSWFAEYGYVSDVANTTAIQGAATQTAANGINSVAECYVIGISPTNETAQFTASISFDAAGNPQIDYDPNLGSARTYHKLYSDDLKSWREWNGVEAANFFKVEVSK